MIRITGYGFYGVIAENTFFDGHDELYHHAKFGEDRTKCAGCRCEYVVFVTVFFVCHAPSP